MRGHLALSKSPPGSAGDTYPENHFPSIASIMASNAMSRLKKELRQLMKEPEPVLRAMPRPNNLLVSDPLEGWGFEEER